MFGFVVIFLLVIITFSVFIGIAYPKDEGGNKTLFGGEPKYLLQKVLELILLPVIIGLLLLLFS